jgi:hypothetical protein
MTKTSIAERPKAGHASAICPAHDGLLPVRSRKAAPEDRLAISAQLEVIFSQRRPATRSFPRWRRP